MSDDLERRIIRLEANQDDLGKSLTAFNTTLALLTQTVETMAKNEEKKKAMLDKGIFFVLAAFLTAFVTWIVGGGLSR